MNSDNDSPGTTESKIDDDWVEIPSVFVIGWLPKVSRCSRVPAGLRNHRFKWTWFGMLLTGNHPPPKSFDSLDDLEKFAKKKGYRCIAGFRDVKIRPPRDGESECVVKCTRIEGVGYTPIPPGIHSQGEGRTTKSHSKGPTYANFPQQQEFRVGRFLNWLHSLVTGHKLPHAVVNVYYSVDYLNGFEIEISSSNIPNITIYVDCKAVRDYSIEGITVEQAEQFATALANGTVPDVVDRFVVESDADSEVGITIRPGGIESDLD